MKFNRAVSKLIAGSLGMLLALGAFPDSGFIAPMRASAETINAYGTINYNTDDKMYVYTLSGYTYDHSDVYNGTPCITIQNSERSHLEGVGDELNIFDTDENNLKLLASQQLTVEFSVTHVLIGQYQQGLIAEILSEYISLGFRNIVLNIIYSPETIAAAEQHPQKLDALLHEYTDFMIAELHEDPYRLSDYAISNAFITILRKKAVRHSCTAGVGSLTLTTAFTSMGEGTQGMFETMIVTILVASVSALMEEYGGFEAILAFIRAHFRGRRGGMLGIAFLTSFMDIATANNTVAIVVAAPIARTISQEYGIEPKKTASLLDTCSCIFQGIIPYGAQLLIAASIARIPSITIIPYLFYPYLLLACVLVFIALEKED